VDSQRAVLIAAAACEIKSKLVMREKVDASKAELLSGRILKCPAYRQCRWAAGSSGSEVL